MNARFSNVALHVVSDAKAPEPPYPGDILARGWRFDLEPERIRQSDTWALAGSEWRPWLLMLWMTSWEQRPVGTLPNSHEIIAALIGLDLRQFSAHADILLRGWCLHSDGRLYHPTITERVLSMSDKRVKDRERVARWRACNALPTRDQRVSTTPTPTPTPTNTTETVVSVVPGTSSGDQKCPHQAVIDLYHKHLPANPRIRTWNGQRPIKLRARWREHPELPWWDGFLAYAAESAFLTGRKEGRNGSFLPDLEWIVTPKNFQRINEGFYHREF